MTEKKPYSLCLFTREFPYGNAEAYIESEINILIDIFDKIYIFTSSKKETTLRPLPPQFEIIKLDGDWAPYKNRLLAKNIFFIVKVLFNEFLFSLNKKIFFRDVFLYKNMLLHKIYLSEQLHDIIAKKKINNAVFCSYWFNDWSTVLSILKNGKKIKNFFSRGHGFDIYDDRYSTSLIPFRLLQIKMVDTVFSVSKKGADYLIKRTGYAKKITTSYLGVPDLGENPFKEDAVFTLVSCSNVNIFKRVDAIVDILKDIKFDMKWVHFGDGDRLDEVKNKALSLPSNIKVEFTGNVSNSEIMKFYQFNTVHLFITTSQYEGLPMTLIEASSFGIPLMGTNVGGIPEIINERTGIVIPENFEPAIVAKIIEEFKLSSKNSTKFRAGVKEYWKQNFNSEKNYREFYSELIKKTFN